MGRCVERMGIRAYLPTSDLSQRTKFYPAERFHYEAEHDHYLCPQGQTLRLSSRRQSEQVFIYAGEAAVCNACPVKAECTESNSGRHICRSFFQDYLDRVERKRSVWVEPLFGEAKQFHGLRRFRLRGLWKVNIEGVLTAAGQNLKRLLKCLKIRNSHSLLRGVQSVA